MNEYGGDELEPEKVILGWALFWQTDKALAPIVADGRVVTTTLIVVFIAQVLGADDVGEKVYGVEPGEAALIAAGDQDPAIPLFDVVGKASGVAPWQYGPSWVNNGVVFGWTVIAIVVVVAQVLPADGVNV